ncbi:MAG: hypothetical protein ING19_01020 [Azospirillum sp.]|nr:hypothetical protein [Azospirillum sp.]
MTTAEKARALILPIFDVPEDNDAPNALVVKMTPDMVRDIVRLSRIVKENDLLTVSKFSSNVAWSMGSSEKGEEFDFPSVLGGFSDVVMQQEGEQIGETSEEVSKTILKEFFDGGISDLQSSTEIEEIVVMTDSVNWTAAMRYGSATMQSVAVPIRVLCERFGVDLPAHLEPKTESTGMKP